MEKPRQRGLLRLHNELLLEIGEHLGPTPDLSHLAQANLRLGYLLTPLAYRLRVASDRTPIPPREQPSSSLLLKAIREDDECRVRLLVHTYRADVAGSHHQDVAPLAYAVVQRATAAFRALLAAGANPQAYGGGLEGSLLHVAARCGAAGIVAQLVAAGCDVNAAGSYHGGSPLHDAAGAEVVGVLVAAGARLEATDADGRTPLRRAVDRQEVGAARALLEAGASPALAGLGPGMRVQCFSSGMLRMLEGFAIDTRAWNWSGSD